MKNPRRRNVTLSLGLKRSFFFISFLCYIFPYYLLINRFMTYLYWVSTHMGYASCRRMIYSESRLASMEQKSTDSFLLMILLFELLPVDHFLGYVELRDFILTAIIICSWTIIASKFKDKTTRQCRRRWSFLNWYVCVFWSCFIQCFWLVLCFPALLLFQSDSDVEVNNKTYQMVHILKFWFQERRVVTGGRYALMWGKLMSPLCSEATFSLYSRYYQKSRIIEIYKTLRMWTSFFFPPFLLPLHSKQKSLLCTWEYYLLVPWESDLFCVKA